jgi:hypothetical protein
MYIDNNTLFTFEVSKSDDQSILAAIVHTSIILNYMELLEIIRIIGKICAAKCEEENRQIIIIQGIDIAMKTCFVFNIIVKKIKLKHPNLTSQILLER